MPWELEVSTISNRFRLFRVKTWGLAASLGIAVVLSTAAWARADTRVLESPVMRVGVDSQTGCSLRSYRMKLAIVCQAGVESSIRHPEERRRT